MSRKITLADALKTTKCWRCRGDGSFWICPEGFNPFSAGLRATASASRKVDPCYECRGSGWLHPVQRVPQEIGHE